MQVYDQPVVWQGLYHRTLEFFTWRHHDGHSIRSHITGMIDNTPAHVTYIIETDVAGYTRQVIVELQSVIHYSLNLERRPSGHWHDASGQQIAALQGCDDVDISITPFTNTLAINRLQLATGEAKIAKVLYIDLEKRETKAVEQQYTNLGEQRYRYESLDSGFTAEIKLDEQNLVMDYPRIWKRLYPVG